MTQQFGRLTPITFSRTEVGVISELLNTPDKPILCPKCESSLKVEESGLGELEGQVYLKCHACNRTAFISREPSQPPFDLYG
jgi:hypothetical protein